MERSKISENFREAYSEPCKTCKMECFAKIVNGFQSLIIFAKCSNLDVWQGSEYASEVFYPSPLLKDRNCVTRN